MSSYILIIGANSDIAKELAKIYAKNGYSLYLAARQVYRLNEFSQELKIDSNIEVYLKEFDIVDFDSHKNFYENLEPKPIGVIICSGFLVEQKECEHDFVKALNTININYTGAVSILNIIANDFEKNKKGFIVGISSVSGDRGRGSNYIYGSSKAAFSAYLSGLRNRVYKSNVDVLTVKPGFVYTKMTQHLKLPEKLSSYPKDVALDIYKAQQEKKDILYTKSIWKFIMFLIRILPEFIFKRTSI